MGFRPAGALGIGVVALFLLSVGYRAAEPTAADLASSLQRKYSGVRDFSADFSQDRTGGPLNKRQTQRGKVQVKKPGRMRWEYETPEKKLFVSDGLNMYTYIPQDRQVFIMAMPQDNKATTPILFLAGKGDLTRDFIPSSTPLPPGMPQGAQSLKLTPKTPQPEYEWLTLTFDPRTFAFMGLSTLDAQGSVSSFAFTNWKENPGLPEKLFAFKVPSGVDVVTDASSSH
jgi:outer membrane lipoprotein carrier protein